MHYSPSHNSFYTSEIHGDNIPAIPDSVSKCVLFGKPLPPWC